MQLSLILTLLPALALAAPAPVLQPRAGTPIPGRYIVRLKSQGIQGTLDSALSLINVTPAHVYNFGNFAGFAAKMSDGAVRLLQNLPGVEYIEQDAVVTASLDINLGDSDGIDLDEIDNIEKRAYTTQSSAPWGLSRISNQNKGFNNYTYDTTAGTGACVYVIDTGIYTAHPEFEGRAVFLANYAGDGSNTDGNGHGTHCAGTVGSKTYGVAKKAKIFAVKVLDGSGSGTNSGVIAGINFVANDFRSRAGCTAGSVGSLSLGGAKSTAVNSAVANAVNAGVFMAVAAGNEGQNASNVSPASEPTAFTVAASDSNDKFASFSNWGPSVDIIAPGVAILSTWKNGGTNTLSGTSMATPHVAGLAAYLLAFEGKRTPAALATRLQSLALKGKITNITGTGTPNSLAFNGYSSSR